MQSVEERVGRLVKMLTRFHWSPNHPSTYTIDIDGTPRGIGRIAAKNYGAFNLAWGACDGKWETKAEQSALVTSFSKYSSMTIHTVNKEPVGDWACLLGPKGFYHLVLNSKELSDQVQADLVSAASGAMNVQHV